MRQEQRPVKEPLLLYILLEAFLISFCQILFVLNVELSARKMQ